MLTSINPYTGEQIAEYKELSKSKINKKLELANKTFSTWRNSSFERRAELVKNLAIELRENKATYAKTMTAEMGKPIAQARAEVEKCAWVCDYYAEQAETHLSPKTIETDAAQSYVSYEPLGVVLAVMPW